MNRDYRTARYLFPFWSMLFVCFGLGLEARAQVTLLDAPAFSVTPKNLSQAAAEAPQQKNAQIMILLDEERDTIDADGRARQVTHMIYRVDTQSGVENWASISAAYWPWYQTKPMLRARVITPGDGVQHDLDPKSLSDHALKDRDENVFSDEYVFEGPLPAVTVGSVIEVETVLEDKIPFFQKAWSTSYVIGRNQPVLRTRLVVDAPDSLWGCPLA